MLTTRYVVSIFSTAVIGLVANIACGQAYPNKIVRIVTSGAGGGGDLVARIIARSMTSSSGQQAIPCRGIIQVHGSC